MKLPDTGVGDLGIMEAEGKRPNSSAPPFSLRDRRAIMDSIE